MDDINIIGTKWFVFISVFPNSTQKVVPLIPTRCHIAKSHALRRRLSSGEPQCRGTQGDNQ